MWSEAILDNDYFAINTISSNSIQNFKKVPLYDFPLSVGVGNDLFDEEIPFDEYKTNNNDCDFALHVSGNSMEPDIPDGSIVLIKRSDSIESGEIGAFFYNGSVYCKKLIHEHDKTFLISINSEYEPIHVLDNDTLISYGKVIELIK